MWNGNEIVNPCIPESNKVKLNLLFPDSTIFLGSFSSANNSIRQKNTILKVDGIVSEKEIFSKEVADNTWTKR